MATPLTNRPGKQGACVKYHECVVRHTVLESFGEAHPLVGVSQLQYPAGPVPTTQTSRIHSTTYPLV